MTKRFTRPMAYCLTLALSISAAMAQQAIPQADGIAQAVASMQFANKTCGYNAAPDQILAASASLGIDPADPKFLASVEQKRAVLEQSEAAWTPELQNEFCSSIKDLMNAMGL